MGVRKRNSAEQRKEANKQVAFAKLLDVPTSPRKMRLVVDMVRGMEVNRALGVLKFSNKEAAARVEKLLRRLTGKPKTSAKPMPVNSTSAQSLLAPLPCSSVCAPRPKAAATASASVRTTLPSWLTQLTTKKLNPQKQDTEWDKKLIQSAIA
jgi:ribosomal protein L22